MTKIVRIGKVPIGHRSINVYCKIVFTNGRLSITGVEGPYLNGDAAGSLGQICGTIRKYGDTVTYAPGWNKELLIRFLDIWDRWHLNDTQAGTPAQMEYLRNNPVVWRYPESHYEKALEALTAAGLNPDNGYVYGTKWLHEDVPSDVIAFLEALPDTDKTPAWV